MELHLRLEGGPADGREIITSYQLGVGDVFYVAAQADINVLAKVGDSNLPPIHKLSYVCVSRCYSVTNSGWTKAEAKARYKETVMREPPAPSMRMILTKLKMFLAETE